MKKKSLEGANSICEVGDKIIELENRSIRFSSLRNIKKKELKKKKMNQDLADIIRIPTYA